MSDGVYVTIEELVRIRHQGQGFSFLPKQPVHSLLTGQRASRLRGRGLNFEEVRRYLPGDDIRNIDWKATARTRKPQLRVYTEERDRPVLIIVDQRINMFFGSRVSMKSVTAAHTAALAAWRVLSVGDRPGALVFNDSATEFVRPHRSENRVIEILKAVTNMNQMLSIERARAARPERLNEALEQAIRLAEHDHLIVVDKHDGVLGRLVDVVNLLALELQPNLVIGPAQG